MTTPHSRGLPRHPFAGFTQRVDAPLPAISSRRGTWPRSSALCTLPRALFFLASAPARTDAISAAVGGRQGVEYGRGNGRTPGIDQMSNCSSGP